MHAGEEAAVGVPHGELRVPPVPHAPVRLLGGRAADARQEEGQRSVGVVRGDGDADRTLPGRVRASVRRDVHVGVPEEKAEKSRTVAATGRTVRLRGGRRRVGGLRRRQPVDGDQRLEGIFLY